MLQTAGYHSDLMNHPELEAYLVTVLQPLCEPLYALLDDAVQAADDDLVRHRFPRRGGRPRTELTRLHMERLLETEPIVGYRYEFDPLGCMKLTAQDGMNLRLLHTFKGGVPAPGSNRRRRSYYTAGQERLFDEETAPTLINLLGLFEFPREKDGQPAWGIAWPAGVWSWTKTPRLNAHFRLPRTSMALADLAFDISDKEFELPELPLLDGVEVDDDSDDEQ